MTVTVSVLETVADDINQEVSQANQNAISLVDLGNNEYGVTINGALNSFASTNAAQGTGQWIGLVVNTGESDITSVLYNGVALTIDDVLEASSVGVGAGSFVLWLKAENLPRQFTLQTENKALTTIKIKEN